MFHIMTLYILEFDVTSTRNGLCTINPDRRNFLNLIRDQFYNPDNSSYSDEQPLSLSRTFGNYSPYT